MKKIIVLFFIVLISTIMAKTVTEQEINNVALNWATLHQMSSKTHDKSSYNIKENKSISKNARRENKVSAKDQEKRSYTVEEKKNTKRSKRAKEQMSSKTQDETLFTIIKDNKNTKRSNKIENRDKAGYPIAYKMVHLKPNGWVIVSRDTIANPILGYSFDDDARHTKSMPTALKSWLINIDREIAEGKKQNIKDTYQDKWEWLSVSPERFKASLKKDKKEIEILTVGPLLSTKWSQKQYYNNMCPEDNETNTTGNNHVPVGCVATAMAQIMKYHNWPENGAGSNSYMHPKYGALEADFSNTTYNWSEMPNELSISNDEIAQISYHAGISVNMKYNTTTSSTSSMWAGYALLTHFKYRNNMKILWRFSSYSKFKKAIIDNLDKSLPVYYRGSDAVFGGHAFVCDGYESITSDYYHFNWGWAGQYNGLYTLKANPAIFTFSGLQMILTDIEPDYDWNYQLPDAPIDLNVTQITSESAKLTWKDIDNNETGYKILNSNGIVLKILGPNTKSYKLQQLDASTTYTIGVLAYNPAGNSDIISTTFTTLAEPLAHPTNLIAEDITYHSAHLSWTDNSDNEESFYIYSGSNKITEVGSNITTYDLNGLNADVKYTINVRAHNAMGESNAIYVTFKTAPPIPPKPKNLKVSSFLITPTSAQLSWLNLNTVKNKIYTENNLVADNIATGSYDLDNLSPATEYTYKVSAYNVSGESAKSSVTFTTPSDIEPPSDLVVDNITSNSAKVTWQDNSNNEAGFHIYVGKTLTNMNMVATVNNNTITDTIQELAPNTNYQVYVVAIDNNGIESVKSSNVGFKTLNAVPQMPTNLKATDVSFELVSLVWTPVNNSDGYRLKCNNLDPEIISNNTQFHIVNNLFENTSYTCTLEAYNSNGYSVPASVTFHTAYQSKIISPSENHVLNGGDCIFFDRTSGYGLDKVNLLINYENAAEFLENVDIRIPMHIPSAYEGDYNVTVFSLVGPDVKSITQHYMVNYNLIGENGCYEKELPVRTKN